ncbi:MAG: T9SS type A sorting domain-containing protein, partial [Saprospiraceae bacterium]|nr:T9SS type A sorting domain-containing protein [Saprospiraceae bacterium]
VTLTGSGSNTYIWDNSITDGLAFAPTASQTYSVTGTDANGCTSTDQITINVNANPVVVANTSHTSICQGENLTLFGSGASTYTWDNAVIDNTPFVATASQTYNVTGTDANGCSSTDQVSVTVNALPNVIFTGINANYCESDPPVIPTGIPAGGTFSGNGISNNFFSPSAAGAGSHTITYTFTDMNNCTDTAQFTTNVDASPTINIATTANTVCVSGQVTLTASGNADTYTWDNSVTNGTAFTPSSTQLYTVTATNTSSSCTDTDTITIVVTNNIDVTANASVTTLCVGESVTLTGSGAANYTWNNAVTDAVAFSPTSTATYVVTGTAPGGCVDVDSVTVEVFNLPTVTANASATTLCAGESVTLTGSGAVNYTWNNAVDDGIAFNPTNTGTYTVTGTDANGCSATDQVTITVNALPNVIANANLNTICAGESVILTGAGADSYVWDNAVDDGIAFNPTNTGTYTVTGTDANGCSATDQVTITVNALPNVIFTGLDTNYCEGDPVTLLIGSPTGGTFSGNGILNDVFDPSLAGTGGHTITYTFTDLNNCTNSSSQITNVEAASDCTTGLTDVEEEVSNLIIYPNPSLHTATLELTGGALIQEVEIYSSIGELIYKIGDVQQNIQEVRVEDFPSGLYLVVLKDDAGQHYTKQLIKRD